MAAAPILPTSIERTGNTELRIHWSDGQVRAYQAGDLRDRCPCATCREKHSAKPKEKVANPLALNVLSAAETQTIADGGIRIIGMNPAGSYAYTIDFSDGHNTGLYTLEFLRELGEPVSDQG